MTKAKNYWSNIYLGCESKALLDDLKDQNWKSSYLYSRLQEPLFQLALTFYCSSHSDHAVQIESQEIHSIVKNFLSWMENNNSWSTIWQQHHESKLDLFVTLSLYFMNYSKLKLEEKNQGPSTSSKKAVLELPLPINSIIDGIMQAMTSTTQKLPPSCKLTYQMHLEGLLSHEIAFLLKLSEEEVDDHIFEAKNLLKNPDTWKRAS